MNDTLHTLAVGFPNLAEWLVVAGLAAFIFHKRFGGIGRYLGSCAREFKRGMKAVENKP